VHKEFAHLLLSKDKPTVEKLQYHISQLHLCRSQEQFDQLAQVVKNFWVKAGEAPLVHVLDPQYLSAPWNR
jgi:hypothetical protein